MVSFLGVQTVNSTTKYETRMDTEAKKSYYSLISQPTVDRRLVDHPAIVGRLKNFMVDKVNR